MDSVVPSLSRLIRIVRSDAGARLPTKQAGLMHGVPLLFHLEEAHRRAERFASVRPYLGPISLYYDLIKRGCASKVIARDLLEILLFNLGYEVVMSQGEYEYLENSIVDEWFGIDLEYAASLICDRTSRVEARRKVVH